MIKLDRAIKVFGTKARLADVLGITRSAVSQWDELPLLQQYRLKYRLAPEQFKREKVE